MIGSRRVVRRRNINSYQPIEKEKITKKKKSKKSPKRIIKPIIYGFVILLLIYAVIASNLLKIKDIEIVGNQTLNSEGIKTQVQAVVGSSILNQNILFVSSSQISKQLKSNYYQISNVKLERIPLNTIKITITEQQPSIIWKTGNNTAVFTQDGRAYSGEPNQQLLKSLPIVEDTTNLPVHVGEKVVSEQFIGFVVEVSKQLPRRGVDVANMQIEETTTELVVITKQGYKIRFDTTRALEQQITDLIAVLDLVKKQNKKITQYIDLRINSKVFYK